MKTILPYPVEFIEESVVVLDVTKLPVPYLRTPSASNTEGKSELDELSSLQGLRLGHLLGERRGLLGSFVLPRQSMPSSWDSLRWREYRSVCLSMNPVNRVQTGVTRLYRSCVVSSGLPLHDVPRSIPPHFVSSAELNQLLRSLLPYTK